MLQVYFNHIKVIVLLILVGFLFAFSNYKNEKRKVSKPIIKFIGNTNLFITEATINKLLVQNQNPIKGQLKNNINLDALEKNLNANPMIKNVEVYMSVEGKVSVEIEQKRPIARVHTNASYYIDDEGTYMPLSLNYTARVPLVTGYIRKNNLNTVFQFAKAVEADEFLRKQVIEIHQNNDQTLDFKIRKNDFVVHLGTLIQFQKKINNFKILYQKSINSKILNKYKLINLEFDKQIICTKKHRL